MNASLTSNVRPMSRTSIFAADDQPAPIRPSLALSFSAWKVSTARLSTPLDVSAATTLAEAVEIAQQRCFHKDVFHVLMRDDARGSGTLHIFVIKQQAAKWIRNQRGETVQIKPQYAHPAISIEVSEFVPVEPWRLTRDTMDFTGIDRTLVEQRS